MRRSSLPLLLSSTLLALHGCGGTAASRAGAADTGRATVRVAWPTPTAGRVVPAAAGSILVQLKNATGAVAAKFTIVRPNASGTSIKVKAGTYTLVATAYPTAAATGTPQATGTGSVTIVANTTTPSDVTMGATVTALTVSPTTLTPTVGDSVALAASATNASGAIVLVDPATVHWTSSDLTVATVDATGLAPTLRAVKAGAATISAQFTEVESTLGQSPVNGSASVAITVSAPPPGLANSAWAKFRGDAANTGRGGGSGATGTVTKWQAALSASSGTTSSVYHVAIGQYGTLFTSTPEGKVIALNRTTGAQLWSITPGTASGTATLAASSDGNLYALANTGTLFALNGSTGATIWTFAAGSAVNPVTPLTVGGDGTVYLANGDNTVYAIRNGKQKWSTKIGTTPSGGAAITALALGANGDLYFCGTVGAGGFNGDTDALYALTASTGAKVWSKSGIAGNPAVGDDGTVYLVDRDTRNVVRALDGTSGAQRWASTLNLGFGGSLNASVAVGQNGNVYVSNPTGGFGDGSTIALNAATGSTVWTATIPSSMSPALSSNGTVYIASVSGVSALDGTTGTQRWQYSPVGSGFTMGDVLVVDTDGTLYATFGGPLLSGLPGGLFAIR